MRGERRILMVALMLVGAAQAVAVDGSSTSPAPTGAARHLRAAYVASDRKDFSAAEREATAAIDDPAFASLSDGARHAAFALAAQATIETGDFLLAQRYSTLATAMAQQTLDDWRSRMRASMKLEDARDEAICTAAMLRRYGRDSSNVSSGYVRRALVDTTNAEFTDVRYELLNALYDVRWQDGESALTSRYSRDLSRMLLQRNEPAKAEQAAALVGSVYDVVGMRADNRFSALHGKSDIKSDPRNAAQAELEELRRAVAARPRSLEARLQLLVAMLRIRLDAEVLSATRDIDIAASKDGPPAFDDVQRNWGWILNERARALEHMGRYEEAVSELRRGVELAADDQQASLRLNLADLLCKLDRPDEALAAMPADDDAALSPYGQMVWHLERFTIAIERGDYSGAQTALAFLRGRGGRYPSLLQDALVRSGADNDAEQVLISRLSDPEQRTAALIEVQTYSSQNRPPRAVEWHKHAAALPELARVRALIAQIGTIHAYPWLKPYNDD